MRWERRRSTVNIQKLLVLSGLGWWGLCGAVVAQTAPIAPDNTLPQPSQVQTNGQTLQIHGGTRSGGNLFHSFERFSVPEGFTAWFNTSADVQNAIARVTGTQASEILGTLKANGATNLFLLNPNGIVFGPNAQLQLGGAFTVSTADGLILADNTTFWAGRSGDRPLLSASVPVGLQLGQQPGPIDVRGTLVAAPGQSINLVGGSVQFAGGRVVAPQGQIELVSAAGGTVQWQADRTLALGTARRSGSIALSQQSAIDVSGPGSGAIGLQASDVSIQGGSTVTALTQGDVDGGGVTVRADRMALVGANPSGDQPSAIVTDTSGAGRGGNIAIDTGILTTQGTALLSASTFGPGPGGNITLRASEQIALSGIGLELINEFIVGGSLAGQLPPTFRLGGAFTNTAGLGPAGSIALQSPRIDLQGAILFSPTFGAASGGSIVLNAETVNLSGSLIATSNARNSTGVGGALTIETGSLLVKDGTLVLSVTLGDGPGGALTVRARDRIEAQGAVPGAAVASGIFTNTITGNGRGGDMVIDTDTLVVRDGAFVGGQSGANIRIGLFPAGGIPGSIVIRARRQVDLIGTSGDGIFSSGVATDTFTANPAGNVLIETPILQILGGATLSSSAVGLGRGGDITVRADRMDIDGQSADGFRSGLLAVSGREDLSQITATGDSGSLNLQVRDLEIRNGGLITVSSSLTGDAGSLNITGDRLRLENSAIIANTAAGRGGNIDLRIRSLQMLDGSSIATNALRSDGGNIRFDVSSLAALQNSDITANAQAGRGGRVEIQAETVLGTAFRPQLTSDSDITATSGLGANFSGAVQISTQNFNDESGLVDLPEDTLDPTAAIILGCAADEGNRFVVTGRGGIPQDPDLPTSSTGAYWDDLRWPDADRAAELDRPMIAQSPTPASPPATAAPVVEAAGWVNQADGSVALVASGSLPPLPLIDCRQLRSRFDRPSSP
ncbi:MAG: filamentous hemagglutinin N-terminal domain-containing protein [Oscillatoriales cyanobacterium]|nr:MAG: filamentous hemagglutinin N-terminal domain-containing protein [Oscillatoriales cyanobacterium]